MTDDQVVALTAAILLTSHDLFLPYRAPKMARRQALVTARRLLTEADVLEVVSEVDESDDHGDADHATIARNYRRAAADNRALTIQPSVLHWLADVLDP